MGVCEECIHWEKVKSEQRKEIDRLRAEVEHWKRKWEDLEINRASCCSDMEEENERLRKALEETNDGFGEDFDYFVKVGLLVEVPSNEAFRDEWGDDADTMWVWAWHPLAREEE